MKKRIPLLISFVFGLTACGSNSSSNYQESNDGATPIIIHEDEDPIQEYAYDSTKAVDVFIMLGQSNMEGNTVAFLEGSDVNYLADHCSEIGEDYNLYKNGFNNIQISYCTQYSATQHNESNKEEPLKGAFVSVKVGQGYTGNNRFGPELGIAKAISGQLTAGRTLYLIKYAVGATGFYGSRTWLSPSSGSIGLVYKNATTFIDNSLKILLSEGKCPVVRGVAWMQGEQDASASNYLSYFSFVSNMINDLGVRYQKYCLDKSLNNFSFIDATINENATLLPHYPSINEQKFRLSEKRNNNYIIDTSSRGIDLHVGPDGGDQYHYNVPSMLKLGKAFGQIIVSNNLINK